MTLEDFRKATTRLDEAARQPKNEFLRDSVILRFKFCIELAWKTAKRAMGADEQVYAFACGFVPHLQALVTKLDSK